MYTQPPQLKQAFALWNAGRSSEAIVIINQLAAQNEPGALATLAEMKWRGGVMAQDPVAARDLYRRASEGGHPLAIARYTNLLANGVAGARDWPAALRRLREEAKRDPQRRDMLTLIERMKLTADGDPKSVPEGERLSEAPEAILYPRLLVPAECEYLKKAAEPGYMPSVVNDSSGRQVRDPIRTSDGSTFHWLIENPAVHAINRRLAAASGTRFDQGEAMQILRYQPGQEYRPHLDFVRASDNSRVLTALIYLNEDYEGGETFFLKTALKVKGRKGDVLVFRSAAKDGGPDPLSEHAGLPVTSGTKYLASRWIREKSWIP